MKPKIILVLVLVVLAIIILIQNRQVVTYHIFFWEISMSQMILLPLTVFTGFLIGYIVAKITGNKERKIKKE